MSPNTVADSGSKRVIRPLCYAPKSLIEKVAEGAAFPVVAPCDYAEKIKKSGDRARLERLLVELEKDFPHITSNMLKSLSDVRPSYLLDQHLMELIQPEIQK